MNMKCFFKKVVLGLSLTSLVFFSLITEAAAEQSKIVLATDDLPPFFSKNLPDGGYMFEITEKVFLKAGYLFEVKWVPWKRAFMQAKKGVYTGVMGAYHNKERSQDFVFTDSVTTADLSFFKRAEDSVSYTSLSDLKSYTIGVIRGTAPAKILSEAVPPLTIEEVTKDEQNIKKLMVRRIDLFLTDLQYVNHILRNNYPELKDKINDIQPPLRSDHIYNVISKNIKNHQKIADDFNRGLQQIKKDGTYDNILKKHGIK